MKGEFILLFHMVLYNITLAYKFPKRHNILENSIHYLSVKWSYGARYHLNGLQGNELNMFEQKNHQLKWPQSQPLIVIHVIPSF